MLPYIQILGRSIPMYSIMAFAGIISAYIYLLLTYKKLGIEKDDCDFSFIYGLIGVFIGAKLLSLLLSLPNIINDFHMLFDDTEKFLQLYIFSGFIFYGGLIGAFVGALIYIKKYKLNPDLFFKLLVPTIPLVHSIGRIGCFFAGCCYGIPVSNSLGMNMLYKVLYCTKQCASASGTAYRKLLQPYSIFSTCTFSQKRKKRNDHTIRISYKLQYYTFYT